MWRALANPQKDVSIRRLTTGGATACLRVMALNQTRLHEERIG
jgi:hypothetical protein